MTPSPSLLKTAPYLAEVMPYIRDVVEKLQNSTKNRALALIATGDLTPELAQALWLEMWAAEKIESRLDGQVATAQALTGRGRTV